MKKALLVIPYLLLYLLVTILTIEKRNEYMMAKSNGGKFIASEDRSLLIPGTTIRYYFDKSQKPVKEYVTWSEFWKARGY